MKSVNHFSLALLAFLLLFVSPLCAQQIRETGTSETTRALITRAIAAKTANDPQIRLESFSFRSYQKTLITANPDSIRGLVDSVFKRNNKDLLTLKTVDSGAYRLKKRLQNTHLYMTETAMRVDFRKEKGRKETILGSRMAGLDKRLYRLLTAQLQSFSFYNESYRLQGITYKSPLAENALNTYHYEIVDTVSTEGRPGYKIAFYPKKPSRQGQMQGLLYLDTTSLALQKGTTQSLDLPVVSAAQEYRYYEEEDLWFPLAATLEIRNSEQEGIPVMFDDVLFEIGNRRKSRKWRHTQPEDPVTKTYFISRLYNSDIALNQPVRIESRTRDIEVSPLSELREDSFWEERRYEALDKRENTTYRDLDNISETKKINKRIDFLNKLFTGYLPTKYFDFDLKYLIKYNNYEAFRTGMGIITNNNFSRRFTVKGYGVYGTRDQDFKYGINVESRLDSSGTTNAGINYTDDLTETGSAAFLTEGRTFYVFEPRLFNITSFHRSKSGSTYVNHEINPALKLQVQWTQADTQPTYAYAYLKDGRLYSHYQTNTLTASGFWAPFNRYMVSKDGNTLLEPGWPQINLQITKGFEGVMGSDFSFTKMQLRIRQDVHTFGAGTISLNLNAGYALGELPLTELYNASPNQPTKDALLQRFSVAGYDSFETMYFDEFFSDRYLTFQAKYLLPRIRISRTVNPQVVLISRYALGDIREPDNHFGIPFKSLEKGYYETGVEFNNIISGFGLSTMYRYGPYTLPLPEDNISLKFTFYLSLGI